jgi:uncharacterized integral membrane protein
MRARTISLIVFILLVAVFVAFNWSEFMRPAELSFGFRVAEAPLGLVMLGLLALALVVFLAASAIEQTANLIETRKTAREMTAQRELADKAEASRFTELRVYLDQQTLATQQREAATAAAFNAALAQHRQEIKTQIEASGNTLAAYIGELEDRITHPNSGFQVLK